jgi:vitamin-K-epoxide reductase (warfarin-sensitive)
MRNLIMLLAVLGIVVSSITLRIHYANETQLTPSRSHWNSSLVSHSSYAVVAGIPVAAFGIAGFAIVGLLAFFRRRILTATVSLFGLAYALYLTNIQAHILQVWCIFCVSSLVVVALITLLAFSLLILGEDLPTR